MHHFMLAAQAANDSSDADAFFGFLLICFIIWIIYKICNRKPPTYDFSARGTLRPR